MLLVRTQRVVAASLPADRRRGASRQLSTSSRRRRHSLITTNASSSSSSYMDMLRARPPAAAAALTGAYALIAGAALVALPVTTLSVLAPVAAAAMDRGFIRVGGLILATFGAQYALASFYDCTGRCSAEAFYRASVPSRLALAVGLAALVFSGQVEQGVLVLAALNATGALAMRRALRRQRR